MFETLLEAQDSLRQSRHLLEQIRVVLLGLDSTSSGSTPINQIIRMISATELSIQETILREIKK